MGVGRKAKNGNPGSEVTMHTFHFDLNHVEHHQNLQLFLKIRGQKHPLHAHTEETLATAAAGNKAAATLLKVKPRALTHYAVAARELFHDNSLTRMQIVGHADESDPNNHLPPLYHVVLVPNLKDHAAYCKRYVVKFGKQVPHVLHAHGIMALAEDDDPWQVLVDAYHLQGPLDVAMYLSGQHPLTMSNKPQVYQAMQKEHVYPLHSSDPDSVNQVNAVQSLNLAIQQQGLPGPSSGFAIVKQAVDTHGTPMTYGFDVGPRKAGDAMLVYDLTDKTNQWVGAPAGGPVRSSRNDPQFKGQTWWVNQGQSNYDLANQPGGATPKRAARSRASEVLLATTTGGIQWQVTPNTSAHGITVDQSSISIDDNNNFKADVFNNFLRTVGGYVQYFTDVELTNPINNPAGWTDRMPIFTKLGFQTDDKKYVSMIPNVDTIMGIPLPTDPTNMQMVWPKEAQAAKLLFGGIGSYNYDTIVWPGFVETGIFQFGIPVLFMAAGAAVTDSQWYKDFIKDTDNIAAAVGVGFSAGSAGFGAYSAVNGLKKGFITFGDILAGVLVSKGFEKLSEYIIEKITASELADSAPFVGWVLRIAAMALDGVEMLVTLGECLSSPAVIELAVTRQMTFNFTLHPDPKHGEAGHPDTAIWPAVADHYRLLVNYKNGTGFEAKGKVPLTSEGGSSNQPIANSFTVPWGGKMQVIAAVYSENGWLCGKYISDWMDAVPDKPVKTGIKAATGNITEILVPLTSDTQYNFFQKVAYDDTQKHYWWGKSKGATAPVETVSSLNPSPIGNNLAQLTGITINRSASVIGYSWQGSGENIPLESGGPNSGQMYVFQNLSVLSDLESRKKFPSFGFKTKPGVAYDVYGGTSNQIGLLNFVLDTRNASIGYLRSVDLFDGSPTFDLDSGKSFGTFTIGDTDAMVVHPNGYIVAANWSAHKLQILPLPEQAVPDASAPAAVVVSGKGLLEGLVLGPKALAISPDGAIYVLESIAERVQSFDIKGNAAPSFPGKTIFTVTNGAAMGPALDQLTTPADLVAAFVAHDATHLFDIDTNLAPELDAGVMTKDILNAFSDHMVYLAYMTDPQGNILPDPKQTAFITVVERGQKWTVTDPSRGDVYTLLAGPNGISVRDTFTDTQVIILQKGTSWQLKDLAGGTSFLLTINGADLAVAPYLSYFVLNPFQEELTYCDLAIESKGYVYVLAYKGDAKKGTIPNTAYVLDVYTPQGVHLFRSPDPSKTTAANMEYVVAEKLAIDLWRNMFALNYEQIAGPGGRTEPSVSQWSPTPPLFDLDKSSAPILNSADMSKIRPLFAPFNITFSASASCKLVQKDMQWSISDPPVNKAYDAVLNYDNGNIEVYNIPMIG
jgi:hypothetical protein